MIDVTLLPGHGLSRVVGTDFRFGRLIDAILDGPLDTRSPGRKLIWEDLRSGEAVTLFQKGNKIKKIEVDAEVWYGPEAGNVVTVMEVKFSGKLPKRKDVEALFEDRHELGDGSARSLFGGPLSVTDEDGFKAFSDGASNFVVGSPKRDVIKMKAGDDYVQASGGNDRIDGGKGLDRVDYSEMTGGVKIKKAPGEKAKAVKPDGSRDMLIDVEGFNGTNDDDVIDPRLKKSGIVADGLGGDDRLIGGRKDDVLRGGPGSDFLNGKGGDDLLVAGFGFGPSFDDGQDVLKGGGGSDMFVIQRLGGLPPADPPVVIKDFKNGTDFIGLVDMQFDELTFDKRGKDTAIQHFGQDVALLKKTAPRVLDREDFHNDVDTSLAFDLF
ncbi:MAG: calcium-binding protein [Paracoccaceae bacterium]